MRERGEGEGRLGVRQSGEAGKDSELGRGEGGGERERERERERKLRGARERAGRKRERDVGEGGAYETY